MLTIIIGINPINMSAVDRSAANILRAESSSSRAAASSPRRWKIAACSKRSAPGSAISSRPWRRSARRSKQALSTFLGLAELDRHFHLGSVWDRAKRIFTEPIDRLIEFGKGLVTGILKFIKDAILLPLAKLAEGTRGWDLLIAVLGQNPITGEKVPRTAETLIGGFLKLIGQDEVWANMRRPTPSRAPGPGSKAP